MRNNIIPNCLNINGHNTENLEAIANHFNTYFLNVAEKLLKQNNIKIKLRKMEECKSKTKYNLLTFKPATCNEVKCVIQTIKPKLSSGIDNIPSKVLTFCKEELVYPLTIIVNKSITQGVFPSALKI